MERLKKPTTIAALTWLKDRWVSMKVPESRAMVEKAIEEIGYRIPKKPESKNYHFGGMFLPACPTCGEFLEDENYCPKCGQAIEWDGYGCETWARHRADALNRSHARKHKGETNERHYHTTSL